MRTVLLLSLVLTLLAPLQAWVNILPKNPYFCNKALFPQNSSSFPHSTTILCPKLVEMGSFEELLAKKQ